jgi:hypothetical protein
MSEDDRNWHVSRSTKLGQLLSHAKEALKALLPHLVKPPYAMAVARTT